MKAAEVHPIGIASSPYRDRCDAPWQGRLGPDVEMEIEIFPAYAGGIGDLAGISHLFVLPWFDRASRTTLTGHPPGVKRPSRSLPPVPRTDRTPSVSISAGSSPLRGGESGSPAPGALDGTPALDIKPYAPSIDAITDAAEPFRDDR